MEQKKGDDLDEFLKKAGAFAKGTLKLSPIVGFIFLNGYLSDFGASFPIELESLPVLLLSMGFMSLLMLSLISGVVVLGGAYNVDPLDIGYRAILQVVSKRSGIKPLLLNAAHIFLSYVIPFLVAFAIFNWMDLHGWWMLGELVIISITWSLCYGCWVTWLDNPQNSRRMVSKVALHVFGTLSLSFVCCIVFLLFIFGLIKPFADVDEFILFTLAVLYALVSSLCMYPEHSKKTAAKVIDIGSKLTEQKWVAQRSEKVTPLVKPWVLIAVLSLYGLLIPDVSYVIGKFPLRIMHIGGELNFTAQDKAENCAAWPEYIKAESEKVKSSAGGNEPERNYCKSKPGKLILKIKDRVYAVFEDDKGVPHLESLHVEDASIENDLPKTSLYAKSVLKARGQAQ